MPHRCPWWLGYLIASPLRRLWHDPHAILAPYVAPGMMVLEPGPGIGYFTMELARLVGPAGRVIAVDVQPRMLAALRRRAAHRGLTPRIETRLAEAGGADLGDLSGRVDFALLFAMVHEVDDPARFIADVAAALKPGGKVLLAEPRGHVTGPAFAATLGLAAASGFRVLDRPPIRSSHGALLAKG